MLLARSLITTRGRELTGRVPRSPTAAAIQAAPEERFELHKEFPLTMHPEMLAAMADTLAGGSVRLLRARVVGVFGPRVFLIETQTSLLPAIKRDRVLVFIESGSLRVDPAVLVASTVTVSGVADAGQRQASGHQGRRAGQIGAHAGGHRPRDGIIVRFCGGSRTSRKPPAVNER